MFRLTVLAGQNKSYNITAREEQERTGKTYPHETQRTPGVARSEITAAQCPAEQSAGQAAVEYCEPVDGLPDQLAGQFRGQFTGNS